MMHSFDSARSKAFSLVEIVLALGVCAFAFVAVLGLLPVCLQSASDSIYMTRQSAILQSVSAHLEKIGFAQLKVEPERRWTFDANGVETDESREIYFQVTTAFDGGVKLPGVPSASEQVLQLSVSISTPAETKTTSLTIPNMGY